ncbi:NADH dehydrogenase subunit D [Archaeoglobus sulfaticallidus PM70-1]|uniref:NADH dehydrogenase subunit D n=1 Tax=Archaeoglobus sulfaticallidus PM70-1 TaxID=387631 RepID=N0BN37_9EURY|nr:NADH-quinone oxidoreductase subunit D [Archaeoglobus sulfaticallidus]AGK61715.1 NADH dehydrogenase subunit D [Archaeoglobus sulfaticallidus PM70-1]
MEEITLDVPVSPPTEMFMPIPKKFLERAYQNDDYLVLVGPQHPGSGHMRIILRIKGDIIVEAIPDPGYVHRSMEKLAENRLYIQNIPLFERPAIMDTGNMTLGYVRAIEQALDIEVPERAKYIRMIVAELGRIGTHLYDAGILAVFLGHTTGFMWPFALREPIIEALTKISGTRITASYIIPGGVRRDVDLRTLEFIRKVTFVIERRLKSFERIFIKNPTVITRLRDVGILSKEEAIKYGVVGPFLRASGVEYDVRVVEPYEAYDSVNFDIPVADEGDSYSRFLVRVEEISQSFSIIRQAINELRKMKEGNILSDQLAEFEPSKSDVRGYFYRIFGDLILPRGEFTALTEASRGSLLYSIISDGESNVPYRVRIVTPGWYYLKGFMESLRGERVADLQAIYGSFGYFPPEADR